MDVLLEISLAQGAGFKGQQGTNIGLGRAHVLHVHNLVNRAGNVVVIVNIGRIQGLALLKGVALGILFVLFNVNITQRHDVNSLVSVLQVSQGSAQAHGQGQHQADNQKQLAVLHASIHPFICALDRTIRYILTSFDVPHKTTMKEFRKSLDLCFFFFCFRMVFVDRRNQNEIKSPPRNGAGGWAYRRRKSSFTSA